MSKCELNGFLSNFEPDAPCQFEILRLCDFGEYGYRDILKTKARDEWPLFHHFVVLRHAEVQEVAARIRIIEALIRDINEPNVMQMKCLTPHHGVRIIQNGQWVDLVICYMCGNFEIFMDDKTPRPAMGSAGGIGIQSQWVLDELLN